MKKIKLKKENKNIIEEIKKIAIHLLTSVCVYKYTNRSGWICGFGNGIIAHIEDHKNELVIKTNCFYDTDDLHKSNFISNIINIESISSEKTKYRLLVTLCNKKDYPDNELLKIAKRKIYFNSIPYINILEIDVENEIQAFLINNSIKIQKS